MKPPLLAFNKKGIYCEAADIPLWLFEESSEKSLEN